MSEVLRQLEYAPGAPVRRRRRMWWSVTILLILGLGLAGWHYGPGMVLRARQIYWQRRCMSFQPAPGTVMFEILPPESVKPEVEEGLVAWDSAEVVAARRRIIIVSKTALPKPPTPVVVVKGPTCLLRLAQAEQRGIIDDGAILFCHERTSPAGERRLVILSLPGFGSYDSIMGDMLTQHMQSKMCPIIPWRGPLPTNTVRWGGLMHSGPALPPPRRIFAGVPDPNDPSRFSIEYEWPDGVRGFVDGKLIDGGTVSLTIRPGPGDIDSAFHRGLHQKYC